MSRKNFSRKKIFEIATEYATTPSQYSHDYFERKYEISKSVFYSTLKKAVIEGIVNDTTVEKMKEKAATNSQANAGVAGAIRSRKHYDYLILKRKNYIVLGQEAQKLIMRYLNTKFPKDDFTKHEYITNSLLNRTIYSAIINSWIDDSIVEQLKSKSIANAVDKETIEKFWIELLNVRQECTKK